METFEFRRIIGAGEDSSEIFSGPQPDMKWHGVCIMWKDILHNQKQIIQRLPAKP